VAKARVVRQKLVELGVVEGMFVVEQAKPLHQAARDSSTATML
jgi:hypothetical protein